MEEEFDSDDMDIFKMILGSELSEGNLAGKVEGISKMLICPICGARFKSRDRLKKHIRDEHSNEVDNY